MRARAVLTALLVACAPPTPTPAPGLVPGQRVTVAPIATTTPTAIIGVPVKRATFAPIFTPTPPIEYASGGLGLSRRDWANQHRSLYAVDYLEDRVAGLELRGDRFGWPLEEIRRSVAETVLPADAVYVRTYRTADGSAVDLFHSPSLAARFPSARWTQPGTFAAVYQIDERGRVPSYRVALGDP